jgi:hypothetical protein
LSCLTKKSSVFSLIFILSLMFEILFSTCSSPPESPYTVFFCLTKVTFYFQDLSLILFSKFSISLFSSFIIFCVVIFNSYIHLFLIESFVSLWSLLKSSLSLFVSVSSHVLYLGCFEIS